VRDLAFLGFLLALIGMGFRRPFLFVCTYIYVDTVGPQRLCYYLLNSIPLSVITVSLAVVGWMIADDKREFRIAPRQWLMLALLGWAFYTTFYADEQLFAWEKWSWVWKSVVFGIFLPFTLRTRLRIEAVIAFILLSVASIVIVGGIKTLATGGGYGSLNLMVDNNSGLYEGSTIAAVSIAIIPLILWIGKFGTIFPRDWRVRLFCGALAFACLLIPVGTQARTGLLCIGLLAVLLLRDAKRRVLYISCMALAATVAIPLLPQAFTARMSTIKEHKADESASTRLAVWAWTWDYVQKHPLGGGFEMYRQNKIRFETVKRTDLNTPVDATAAGVAAQAPAAPAETSGTENVTTQVLTDQGRAFHSSYFEMLGEQGFPGLAMFLLLHFTGLIRMSAIRRRYRKSIDADEAWVAPLATSLQSAHLIYLLGAAFVGIAFLPFIFMIIAIEIGLDTYLAARRRAATWRPMVERPTGAVPATA
jgi:probable O-glycosylation ligase (exosortase A-associated)